MTVKEIIQEEIRRQRTLIKPVRQDRLQLLNSKTTTSGREIEGGDYLFFLTVYSSSEVKIVSLTDKEINYYINKLKVIPGTNKLTET